MAVTLDLILQKPVSVLNAPANINFKAFFTNLGKAVVSGSFGDMKGAAEYGLDALGEVGLQDKPEQAAWLLVSRSLMQALTTQVEDYQDLLGEKLDDAALADLAERVEYTLNAVEISIDASFFERPQNLPLLDDFQSALVFWLKGLGMNDHQAEAFHYRLKGQFVLALHKEWGDRPDSYRGITEQIDTPFTKVTLDERSWQQYNAWLQEQANARVFGEAFGLRQIYIRLRAYYEQKKDCDEPHKQQETQKIVCDLHDEVEKWIAHFNKDDALRVVSGGPGCGKSSFAKILVADLSAQHALPVLFVPLHHFNLNDELIQAVGSFVRNDPYLRGNPMDTKDGQKRLLIIFDGLDELSMQGKAATDVAQQFVDEVMRTLDRYNNSNSGIKWQALITGRDLAVQANASRLRQAHQVLHILPYYLDEEERKSYQDKNSLLEIDQRNIWWQMFGKSTGKDYGEIPKALAINNLSPITREPLLNYLISLSYERSEIVFDENTSLNAIYFDLLKAVHERRYENYQHSVAQKLSFDEFMQVLEEIALAVWHGNGRTASAKYLYERCKESRLDRYLEKFSDDAKQGVVRLLTAFYFREFGRDSHGDKTFEFTHKSFGEYLAARRIVKEVATVCEELERYENGSRGGWSPETAYIEWVKICGPTTLDKYVFRFIKDEIAICHDQKKPVKQWQRSFLNLLSMAVRGDSPMEKVGLTTFSEMRKYSRNAEESLLAIHYACALQTDKVLDANWGDNASFGSWLKRSVPQRTSNNDSLILSFLGYLCLKDQLLYVLDLAGGNFSGANLINAQLSLACLYGANLQKAKLQNASFDGVNLEEAKLQGVNFEKADLRETNLQNAQFQGANLEGVSFSGAIFSGANFQEANLSWVNLEGGKLVGTDFRNAKLTGAYLAGADFSGVKLTGVDLRGANLKGTKFTGANLEGADLEEAYVERTRFDGANLKNTILEGKDMSEE